MAALASSGSSSGGYELSGFERLSLGVVLAFCFFPYVSLGPFSLPSQVQPWGPILAWFWFVTRSLAGRASISGVQLVLVSFAVWFMVYTYGSKGFDVEVYLRRSAAFLLCAGIFLAVQYATPRLVWTVLRVAAPIWFAIGMLRYLAPSLYVSVVEPLVPTVVVSSARGSSSLAPEATDFGFTMVFLLVIGLLAFRSLAATDGAPRPWPLVVLGAAAVSSQSGTGIFGVALVLVYLVGFSSDRSLPRLPRFAAMSTVLLLCLLILDTLPQTDVRGVDLLVSLVREPSSLVDSSASYRIVHNVVGFWGLVDSKFVGYGAGSYLSEGLAVYRRHGVGDSLGLSGYYAANVPVSLTQSPVAFFAVILLEFGAIGLAYLAVLFGYALRRQVYFKNLAVLVMFIAWAQSFPAAWPPFWVLLGLLMSPYFARVAQPSGDRPDVSEETAGEQRA